MGPNFIKRPHARWRFFLRCGIPDDAHTPDISLINYGHCTHLNGHTEGETSVLIYTLIDMYLIAISIMYGDRIDLEYSYNISTYGFKQVN